MMISQGVDISIAGEVAEMVPESCPGSFSFISFIFLSV